MDPPQPTHGRLASFSTFQSSLSHLMRDAERNLASGVMDAGTAGGSSSRREEEKEAQQAGPSARVSTAFVQPPPVQPQQHIRFGSGGFGAPLSPHAQFGSLDHDLAAAGDALARARAQAHTPPAAAATYHSTGLAAATAAPRGTGAAFARVGGYMPATTSALGPSPLQPATTAPPAGHARTISALSAFQAQSSLEDSLASVRALAESGAAGLDVLGQTMQAFKSKMRQAFDTNMLSLDAKVRLVRKDILGHISESNRELENRIVQHLRLNAVVTPAAGSGGAMDEEQAGNMEFRTATQEELLYLKGELAKSALTTQTIQAELERKTRTLGTALQSCTTASNHASAGLVDLQASLIHIEKENAALREELESLKLRARKDHASLAASSSAKQSELGRAVAELKHMVEQQVAASEARAATEAQREQELLAHVNSAAQAYIDEQAAVTSASIASVRRSVANQAEDLERLRNSRAAPQPSRRAMLLSAGTSSAAASQHGGLSFGASASPSVLAATDGADDELDDAAFFAKQLSSATTRLEALESAARSSKALVAEQGAQIDALRAQMLQADSAQRLSLASAVRDSKAEQARADAEASARESHARKSREEMNAWARNIELSMQNLRFAQTSDPSAAAIIAAPAPAPPAQQLDLSLLDESTAKISRLESDVRSLSAIVGRPALEPSSSAQTQQQSQQSPLDLSSQLLALEHQQTLLQTQHFQLVSRVESHAAESMAQLAHLQSLSGQQPHKSSSSSAAEAALTSQQVTSIADASATQACQTLQAEVREEIASLRQKDDALAQGLAAVQEAQRQAAQSLAKQQQPQPVKAATPAEKLVVPRTLTLTAATGSIHTAAAASAAGSSIHSVERVPDSPSGSQQSQPFPAPHQRADQLAAISSDVEDDDPVSEEKFDVPAASSSSIGKHTQWQASPLSDEAEAPRPLLPQALPLRKAAAATAGLPPRSPPTMGSHGPAPIIRVGGPGYASTAAVSKPLLSVAAGATLPHARTPPPPQIVSPSVASNAAALVADSSSEEEEEEDESSDDEASLVDPKQAAHQSLSPVTVPGAPRLRASMSPDLPDATRTGDRSTHPASTTAAAREMRIPAAIAAHVALAPQVSPSTAELAALSPTPVSASASDPVTHAAADDDDSTNGVPHSVLAAQVKQRYLDAELAGQVDGEGRVDEDSLYDHDHDHEDHQQRPSVDVHAVASPSAAVGSPSAATGAAGNRTPKLSAREQKFQALLARHQKLNTYNRNATPPSAASAGAAREALGDDQSGVSAAQTAANLAAAAPTSSTASAPSHRRKPLSSDDDSDLDLSSSPAGGPSSAQHVDLHDNSLLDRTEASEGDASEHDLSLHSKFQQARASQGRLVSEASTAGTKPAHTAGSYAAAHQALQQQSPPVGADWDSEIEEEAMLSASNAPDDDDDDEDDAAQGRRARTQQQAGQESTESSDDDDGQPIVSAAGNLKLLAPFGSSSLSGKAPLPSRHASSSGSSAGGVSELSPLGAGIGSSAAPKPKANLGVSHPGQFPLQQQQQQQHQSGVPAAGFLKQPLGAPQQTAPTAAASSMLPAFARAPLGSTAVASSSLAAAPASFNNRGAPSSAALRSTATEFDDEDSVEEEESDDDLSSLSNDGGSRRSGGSALQSRGAAQPQPAQSRLQPQQAPTFDSDDDLSTLVEHDDVLSPMQSQQPLHSLSSSSSQQRQQQQQSQSQSQSQQYGGHRSRRHAAGSLDDSEQDAGVSELDSLDISASGNDFNTDF